MPSLRLLQKKSFPACQVLLVAALLSVAGCGKDDPPGPPAPTSTETTIEASINLADVRETVPPNFLGLSMEHYNIVGFFAGYRPNNAVTPAFLRLINNLKNRQKSGLILRIGGDSSDEAWWNPTNLPKPNGITVNYADRDLSIIKNVADSTDSKIIFGLNFGQNNPGLALALGQQAQQKFGSSLLYSEIGNEPDIYTSNVYYGTTTVRSGTWTFPVFLTEYKSFLQQLKAAANPIQKIAAPAFTTAGWMTSFTDGANFGQVANHVDAFTYHRYPFQGRGTTNVITLENILTNEASDGLAGVTTGGVKAMVQRAKAVAPNKPFYLSEVGSAAQGGKEGISNSFAAALWGTDMLFGMASAGVAGIQFHTTDAGWYSPFKFFRQGDATSVFTPEVRPFYYSMLLFAQAAPSGARLLPVQYSSADNLKLWATLDGAGVVRIVAINKTTDKDVLVRIALSGTRSSGSLIALKAPSLEATNGVTLAGQTFDGSADGKPLGAYVSEPVPATANQGRSELTIRVQKSSAAMLTVNP